ncbi:hypothetical protein A4X13_0g8407 [Tilletia indica]|uniref:Uncharacterized protein n=1 Tax=Tilletia indica TaxID=43049 RepID=A0A177T256_9BASI|nr:hypothetical protein A4X13_0g8407 [Tilletia indica]
MAPYGNQNSKGKGITTASSDPEGGPSKRTLQNRKAQREFRKRREARVRELEDRCRRYDELGLEANVEIQRVARRLKDENDALRNLLISLGHGKLIPSALENVFQQPQTPSGGVSHFIMSMTDAQKAESGGDANANVGGSSSSSSGSSHATKLNRSNSEATSHDSTSSSQSASRAMGPPMHTSSSNRDGLLLASGVQYSTSAQSRGSSSRGEETESSAYNPPELLQRSALSNSAMLSKMGSGMVGMPSSASSQADERRDSLMAQHIDAAVNNSMTPSVPSLLRLDFANGGRTSMVPVSGQITATSPVNADGRQQQSQVMVKEEGYNQSGMRLGPFGSMGLNMPTTSSSGTSTSGNAQTGPIVSYAGSMNPNYLPFVQPTSINDALLNPNPIPFQFNLSQLSQPPVGISPMHSFSSLADQGTWWLTAGGAQLTPGQDPNALDEKAQAVAAEQQRQQQQQHDLVRSSSQSTNNTTTNNDGGGSSGGGAGGGQHFDLSAFLNGGDTPGGSFKMDGNNTAISGTMSMSSNSSNCSTTHNSPINRRESGFTQQQQQLGADLRGVDEREVSQNKNSSSRRSSLLGNDGSNSRRNTIDSTGRRPSVSAVSASEKTAATSTNKSAAKASSSSEVIDLTSSPTSLSPASLGTAASPSRKTTQPVSKTTTTTTTTTSPVITTSSDNIAPAVNRAKQLLLDGAGPMDLSSSGGAMAILGEGYPSMNIPLKRTLSNALLGSNHSGYGDITSMSPSAFASVPPTKIFRASAPGAAGAVPSGLDNAESTRAFLQLLEKRMAKVDGGLGPVGLYEHLGFRPPSFVAAGAASSAAGGSGSTQQQQMEGQSGTSLDGAVLQQQQQQQQGSGLQSMSLFQS